MDDVFDPKNSRDDDDFEEDEAHDDEADETEAKGKKKPKNPTDEEGTVDDEEESLDELADLELDDEKEEPEW